MVQDAWHPAVYPTRPMGFGARYLGQPCGPTGEFGYDALQSPSVTDNELPRAFRGMVVEEGYNTCLPQSMPGTNLRLHPINLQPPQMPYDSYRQAEYGQYYHRVGREPYADYRYGYDPYPGPGSSYAVPRGMVGVITPTLYPNLSSTDFFFEYGRHIQRPDSQFYYPFHQPLLYPPPDSPMHTPQSVVTVPANKKLDLHVSLCMVYMVEFAESSLDATDRAFECDSRLRSATASLNSWRGSVSVQPSCLSFSPTKVLSTLP
jgi:hypothetical protein